MSKRSREEGDEEEEAKAKKARMMDEMRAQVAVAYEQEGFYGDDTDALPQEVWRLIMIRSDDPTSAAMARSHPRWAKVARTLTPKDAPGLLAREERYGYEGLNGKVFLDPVTGAPTSLSAYIRMYEAVVADIKNHPQVQALRREAAMTPITAEAEILRDVVTAMLTATERFRKYYFHQTMFAMCKLFAHLYTTAAIVSEFSTIALSYSSFDIGPHFEAIQGSIDGDDQDALPLDGGTALFERDPDADAIASAIQEEADAAKKNGDAPVRVPEPKMAWEQQADGRYSVFGYPNTTLRAYVTRNALQFPLALAPVFSTDDIALTGMLSSTSVCLNEPRYPVTVSFEWKATTAPQTTAVQFGVDVGAWHKRSPSGTIYLPTTAVYRAEDTEIPSAPTAGATAKARGAAKIVTSGTWTIFGGPSNGGTLFERNAEFFVRSDKRRVIVHPRLRLVRGKHFMRSHNIVITYTSARGDAAYSVEHDMVLDPDGFFTYRRTFELLRLPAPCIGRFVAPSYATWLSKPSDMLERYFSVGDNHPDVTALRQTIEGMKSRDFLLGTQGRLEKLFNFLGLPRRANGREAALGEHQDDLFLVLDRILLPPDVLAAWQNPVVSDVLDIHTRSILLIGQFIDMETDLNPDAATRVLDQPPVPVHYRCAHCASDDVTHILADGSHAFCARHLPSQ